MSTVNARLKISFWTALIAGAFTALLTLLLSQGLESLPLYDQEDSERVSIAAIVIIATFLIVLITIAVHYRRLAPVSDRVSWLYQLSGRIGAAVLAAVFIMLVCTVIVVIFANAFPGGTLPIFSAVLILTLGGMVLGFFTAYIAVYLNTPQLLVLTGVTLLTGMTIAALAADSRDWWTNSLSFLGWNTGSNLWFDFALILGGLVILAVMGDVLRDLNEISEQGRITRRSYRIMQGLVFAIGIGVVLIGLFPTRVSPLSNLFHQVSAWGVFGTFLLLMVGINRLLPIYPRWFIRMGYVLFGLALATAIAHMGLNAIGFVALELILIGLVAPWCFMFAQQTDQLVTGEALDLTLSPEDVRRLRFALRVGIVAGACALIATFLTFYQQETVSIFSEDGNSFAAMGLVLSFPVALIATAVSYRRFAAVRRGLGPRVLVSIVMALLISCVLIVLLRILIRMFTGVMITPETAAVLTGAIALVISFFIAYTAPYFDGMQELTLTGILFGAGILIATTHAEDPNWWRNSISFLGHDSGAFLVFGVTLVLCGLLLMIVGLEVVASLAAWFKSQPDQKTRAEHLGWLRFILILMSLFVIGIGLFPTTVTQITNDLHNIASHGMLVAFLVLMFALDRLVPAYPRSFIVIGYSLGAAAIANVVAYFAGIFNYVIMEFILVIILGTWLYLFMRNTRHITGHGLDDRSSMQQANQH